MNILINLLMVLLALVSFVMIVVILMQRSKNEGLGAAFGGGAMDTTFGADTANVLKKFTVYIAIVFFALTLTIGWLFAHRDNRTEVEKLLQQKAALEDRAGSPKPAAPAAPVPVPAKK
ncbi:MAG: preprotein translocase subunit SecG [Verrucomicrobiae bacterium]|nr:preprotein translocase subunit SecG [Verrucomicrobiae bacterium]